MNTTSTLFALTLAVAPALVLAQTNPAYAEKAQIVGTGNTIKLYGLPGRATNGTVKYWDTTITIEIDANGRPTLSSPTASVVQPKLKSTEFVQGTYVSEQNSSDVCALVAAPFAGRNQFDLSCVNGGFVVTWYTGPIAGHPWEADLRAAGLDTIVGSSEYSWGKNVVNSGNYFGCFPYGFGAQNISARQVGDRLTVTNWGGDTIANCQVNFMRQP